MKRYGVPQGSVLYPLSLLFFLIVHVNVRCTDLQIYYFAVRLELFDPCWYCEGGRNRWLNKIPAVPSCTNGGLLEILDSQKLVAVLHVWC